MNWPVAELYLCSLFTLFGPENGFVKKNLLSKAEPQDPALHSCVTHSTRSGGGQARDDTWVNV